MGGIRLKYTLEHASEGIGGAGYFQVRGDGGWSRVLHLFALGKRFDEKSDSSRENRSPYIHLLRTRPMTRGDFGWASMLDASATSIPWTGAEIVGKSVFDGEEAYAVLKKSEIGPVREYYSTKSHLLIRRDDAAGGRQIFSDFRGVEGAAIALVRRSITAHGAESEIRVRTADR